MKKNTLKHIFQFMIGIFLITNIFFVRNIIAEGKITIVRQPEDVKVNYPEGASFSVKVNNPEDVQSYQWLASDGASMFVLTGESAYTDTLIIPSTMQDDPVMFYQCKIIDTDGVETYSETAVLEVMNPEESKTVLYVGDYALVPGEKLDLEDTTLGTGTIEFDKDGVNITLTHLVLDNKEMTYDLALSPALCLYLVRRNSEDLEYYFHLVGDCRLTNNFFDEDYNNGGVDFNSWFGCGDDPNKPTIIIDGDGDLVIWGGSTQLYSDGNIELDVNLYSVCNNNKYSDGIRCNTLIIDDGVTANIVCNGTAIHTEGDLRIMPYTDISIVCGSPHVSVGPTTKGMMFIVGSIFAEGADITMNGFGDPKNFVPYNAFIATMPGIILAGEGNVNLDDSDLAIDFTTIESDQDYAMNFSGIEGYGSSNSVSLTNGSTLSISIDAEEVIGAAGINVPGIVDLDPDSRLDVNIKARGETLGIEADRLIRVNDSSVNVNVVSLTEDNTFGIVCGGAEFNINNKDHTVNIVAQNGVALGADTGIHGEEAYQPESGYKAEKIILSGKASIIEPKKASINITAVPGYGEFIRTETVYEGSDVASAVKIGVRQTNVVMYAVLGLLVAGLVTYLVLNSQKNKKEEETADKKNPES